MKRAFSIMAAIGILWLCSRGFIDERRLEPTDNEAASPIASPTTAVEKKAVSMKGAPQVQSATAESHPGETIKRRTQNDGIAQSAELPAEPIPSQDVSGQKDAWFSFYRKDFGPSATEVEGKVTVSYRGYDGKFKVQFLIPPNSYEGTPSVAIFMADEKNPAINALGGAALEYSDADSSFILVRFVGNSVHPFFSKKAGVEFDVPPRDEPNNISTVMFTIDPKKKKGVSDVEARFSFETQGPTTTIGKLDYVVKSVSSTGT